jgi:hypothetical protein
VLRRNVPVLRGCIEVVETVEFLSRIGLGVRMNGGRAETQRHSAISKLLRKPLALQQDESK